MEIKVGAGREEGTDLDTSKSEGDARCLALQKANIGGGKNE